MLVRLSRERMRALLAHAASSLPREVVDESAFPSYVHANPLVRWVVWRRLAAVLDLAGPEALRGRVLDFGCGTGAFLPSLCASAREVWATDPRPELAQVLAEREALPVVFVPPAELAERVEPASLSLVTAVEVLEHIAQPAGVLETLRGLLAPGGRLVVSTPTENWLYRLCRRIAGFRGGYHRGDDGVLARALCGSGLAPCAKRLLPLPFGPALFVVRAYARSGRDGQ